MASPTDKRLLIFANPTSGRGRGVGIAERLMPTLATGGFVPGLVTRPASTLTADELSVGAHAIVVIGGDGTLRGVVEQYVRVLGPAAVPPVLFIGLGTANVMQKHLGLRYARGALPTDVLSLLQNRHVRLLDLAMANDRVVLLMVSCGIDAAVVHKLAAARRGPITMLSYVPPAVETLFTHAYVPVSVRVDGRSLVEDRPALVFVGNVREYGTGFPVLRNASSDDGLLDVCVLPCSNPRQLAHMILLVLRGRHVHMPGVKYAKGRVIEVDSPHTVPVQIDGDAAETLPVCVRLLDARVPFIVR
ncbi:MAG TPA: diacylglycerol kinase family protein [Tepidisphaeraceae bacterium]